jgi:UDP:flavonoid glycosyltransferase YjiC (YdhE family)
VRVLFLPPPAAPSHFLPLVPLAWALRAGGHEVMVGCTPDTTPLARESGLCSAALGSGARIDRVVDEETSEDTFPATDWADPAPTSKRHSYLAYQAELQTAFAAEHVADYLGFARTWAPDLVVSDGLNQVSRPVAGVLGVPLVYQRFGVDIAGDLYDTIADQKLDGLRRQLGLPRLPRPALVLDPCPPSLQWEGAEPGCRMRYVPANGPGSLPSWAVPPPAGQRVCVCPGLTVLRAAGPRVAHRVADALDGIDDVEAIFVMSARDSKRVGRLPPGVRVTESLPLNMFLEACDLLIGYGGSGTALTGIAYGVPQVVFPQWVDQFDYGRRLVAAGAGVCLATRDAQADVAGIRDAVTTVLSDSSYSRAAARLRAENDAAPPPSALVPVLSALAAG